MHIVVCIKQVPDHEGPRESYVINDDLKRVEKLMENDELVSKYNMVEKL